MKKLVFAFSVMAGVMVLIALRATGQISYLPWMTINTVTCYLGQSCTISGGGGGFTAGQDLSGSSTAQTVIGINNVILSSLANGPYYFTAGVPAVETAAQAIAALGATPAINCSSCTNIPAPSWSAVTNGANSQTGAFSTAGSWTFSANGAASASAINFTGVPYAGTGTTSTPLAYFNCSGSTQPSSWSTNGVVLGFNLCSSFAGSLLEVHSNGGSSILTIGGSGAITLTSQAFKSSVGFNGPNFSAEVVASSATPTFSTAYTTSRIVLTANITSFTLGGGQDGQIKNLCFEQGSGPYTVTPPSNVHGFFTVGVTPSDWNCQGFTYDNTNSIWLATGPGQTNE